MALADMRTFKSENAARLIPIDPLIIELGLLERARKLEVLGHTRLFPDWKWRVRSDGKVLHGDALTRDWQRRKADVTTRANVCAYSGRHSMASLLDALEMPQRDRDRVMGHSHPGVSGRYGRKGALPAKLVKAFLERDDPTLSWMRTHLVAARDRAEKDRKILEPWAIRPLDKHSGGPMMATADFNVCGSRSLKTQLVGGWRIPATEAPVLAPVTTKGGAGKSTTTIGIAGAARDDGLRTIILDTDQQQSVLRWSLQRKAQTGLSRIDVMSVTTGLLNNTIRRLRASGAYDFIVIDTPGSNKLAMEMTMRESDLCLVLSRPTVLDIPEAMAALRLLRELGRPLAGVLTQCPSLRSCRVLRVGELMEEHGVAAAPPLRLLVDHQDALESGMTVTEFDPSGSAALELQALWNWLKPRLIASREHIHGKKITAEKYGRELGRD